MNRGIVTRRMLFLVHHALNLDLFSFSYIYVKSYHVHNCVCNYWDISLYTM